MLLYFVYIILHDLEVTDMKMNLSGGLVHMEKTNTFS